jgi:L-lactate dehydrogenase (cytochrome)
MAMIKPLARRPRRLANCYSIDDLRYLAWRKLPSPIFHYMDGGADDETSLRRNSKAFDAFSLTPDCLVDISTIDTSTELLGKRLSMPLLCSPTGMSRLFHREAELAVVRAAARAGVFYSLSTMATTKIERVGDETSGPKMFQIYLFKDQGLTADLIDRCLQAKFDALCLTIDTPLAGNRERDRVTGMQMPPRFTASSFLSFATHLGWAFDLLRNPNFDIANVAHRVPVLKGRRMSVIDYANSQFDRTAGWSQAEALRARWPGPFVIKGIQSVSDARRAVDIGATALMLSNHGGRQLDGAIAPIDLLPRIRSAVGSSVELIVDGGVRRGVQIAKALALGANACSVGRPYLYGLAAGGEAGVHRALSLLREEFERSMALLGAPRVDRISPSHIEWASGR